ncbi:pitrilysin family protein [Thalassoglobus sp. JC818]|uniref:M16 family metallopeptidase n=1 Tax=Thalassoglobus sp. JC818 TaxID=3232136 RepID=UPI0034599728
MKFHSKTLPNGLQIIAEINPDAQSAAIGFLVKTGARDEQIADSGVSHFLEHMAFKGDSQYSAEDVNRIFDEVGASYNASTSEELTFYYAAILPEYLDRTFDLLARLMRPSLREEDFDMEKQVILEEIGMYEDLPGFAVYDQSMSSHFSGHPLGQSILGSSESITNLTVEQMRNYHEQRYGAANLILAATGNLDWTQFTSLVDQYCRDWQSGTPGRTVVEAKPETQVQWIPKPGMNQEHVMQMSPAPPADSNMRFAAEIISTIVGDESSGRLYWDLVETGLAETAELSYNDYDGSGAWAIYLCCEPDQTRSNLDRILQTITDINEHGPTPDELEQARNKVASRIVLSSERPMGRLVSLGGNWLYRGVYRSVTDDLKDIQELTLEDVRELLNRYPIGQVTTVGLGPVES